MTQKSTVKSMQKPLKNLSDHHMNEQLIQISLQRVFLDLTILENYLIACLNYFQNANK